MTDFDIFRTQGRAAKPLDAVVLRSLTSADLSLLADEKGSKPSAIKRLSDRHHALARNLAAGMSESEAAIIVGLTLNRVSILKGDPAFEELLEFYRQDVTRVYRDMHEKLHGVATTALNLIEERLEDEPEKVSTSQLLEITKMGADRSGFGPATTNTNVNVNIDLAGRLEAARKRVEDRRKLIEGEIL